ncbi:hypothetical protein CRENBAI_010952 [Crenichthys baileyi]|uniref:Uncharacterized protein n=1 Tax=Crenichthys baileyi TaxID=28760 RepID=A0AAV9QY87_9TELE
MTPDTSVCASYVGSPYPVPSGAHCASACETYSTNFFTPHLPTISTSPIHTTSPTTPDHLLFFVSDVTPAVALPLLRAYTRTSVSTNYHRQCTPVYRQPRDAIRFLCTAFWPRSRSLEPVFCSARPAPPDHPAPTQTRAHTRHVLHKFFDTQRLPLCHPPHTHWMWSRRARYLPLISYPAYATMSMATPLRMSKLTGRSAHGPMQNHPTVQPRNRHRSSSPYHTHIPGVIATRCYFRFFTHPPPFFVCSPLPSSP